MFCVKCGEAISQSSNICIGCGNRLQLRNPIIKDDTNSIHDRELYTDVSVEGGMIVGHFTQYDAQTKAYNGKTLDVCNVSELTVIFALSIKLLQPAEDMMSQVEKANEAANEKHGCAVAFSIVVALFFGFWAVANLNTAFTETRGRWFLILLVIVFSIITLIALAFAKAHWISKSRREELIMIHANLSNDLSYYIEDELYGSIVEMIPTDFRYSAVLNVFMNYLKNMEASRWQDCIAVWKADLHRSKVEQEVVETRKQAEAAAKSAKDAAFWAFWR